MSTERRAGASAALIQAMCYFFGFALLLTAMNPGDVEGWSQLQKLEFLLERANLFQLWNIVIYVVFGVALVVLATVLHRLLGGPGSLLMAVATPFGYLWAGLVIASGMIASVGLGTVGEMYATTPLEAAQLWTVLGVVQNGLGGGVEVVGGLWLLLLSVSSLRSQTLLPKSLNWLGVLTGVAGIATVLPPLSSLGAVFGLLQLVWFIAVGLVLLRSEDT